MAKVNLKSEKITPFGGIYYASKAFYALSLDKVINGTIGVRSSAYNGYQWGEIMSAMSDVFLCGGDCVEDVNRSERHLRESPVLFGDRYTYRCIITNDWDSEEKCVIETYNKRGARECDFDRHIVNECYDLERIMGNLANFFDYEAFGRELFMYDYTMGANGNVFRNI